jgi:hypothetical protein
MRDSGFVAMGMLALTSIQCDYIERITGKTNSLSPAGSAEGTAMPAKDGPGPFAGVYKVTRYRSNPSACAESEAKEGKYESSHVVVQFESGRFGTFWKAVTCNGVDACRKPQAGTVEIRDGVRRSSGQVVAHLHEKSGANGLKGTIEFSGKFQNGKCTDNIFTDYKLTLKARTIRIEIRKGVLDDFPAKDMTECGTTSGGRDRSKFKTTCKSLELVDATRAEQPSKEMAGAKTTASSERMADGAYLSTCYISDDKGIVQCIESQVLSAKSHKLNTDTCKDGSAGSWYLFGDGDVSGRIVADKPCPSKGRIGRCKSVYNPLEKDPRKQWYTLVHWYRGDRTEIKKSGCGMSSEPFQDG